MIPTALIAFFKEFLNRLRTKSPRFFFIIQVIAASLVAAAYGTIGLHKAGLDVNQVLLNVCHTIGNIAIGLGAGATLPVNGTAQNDKSKLPYTLKEKE